MERGNDAGRGDRPILKELYDHVVPWAASKWKDLAVQILSEDGQHVVSITAANHPCNVEECCKRILEKWLETRVDASWGQLLQALESPSVQLNYLASQINQMLIMKLDKANISLESDRQASAKFKNLDEVEMEFAKMTNGVKIALEHGKVCVASLIEQLCAISAVKSKKVPVFDEDVFEKVTTIDELWKKLRNFWTIFDYDVLIFVVNIAACEEAQAELNSFLSQIHPSTLEDMDLVLRCKVYEEDDFLKPLLRIKVNVEKCTHNIKEKVKEVISTSFKLEKYSLCLKGIKEGCIQLMYHISKAVMSYMLQLKVTGGIIADMVKHKIVSLQMNDMKLKMPSKSPDMSGLFMWSMQCNQDTQLLVSSGSITCKYPEVRCIAQEELIDTVTIGKEATDPTRELKFCTCRGQYGYGQEHAVIVEVIGKKFALFTSKVEDDVLEFFNHCLDVVPCFWSPKVPSHSHLAEIFCEQVLTKLVELMRLYGNSWSVAHMCVSLPLPEDTMMILLASDSFKDHFTSTHHPKGYTLLHLAVEMESLPACRAIMRCSDQWLYKDPGLFVEDNEGVTPLNRAAIAGAWKCSDYLQQSQSLTHDTTPKQPRLSKAPHKFTQGGVPFHSSISYVKSQQQMGMDTQLHDLILKKFPNQLQVEKQRQLVKLLISCNPNTLNAEGMTPLHLAVQAGDVLSVKALIAFDADALVVNSYSETSLDLAKRRGLQDISDLLHLSCHSTAPVPTTLVDYHEPVHTGYTARGKRILCLDGGGIKGLILIDMLSTIEKIAGRRIVELFDWIIGTSTGGILALALVYTDLSLNEIRRMYFDLKNDVFVDKIGDVLLPDEQTEVLESILKKRVGEQTKLGSKTHPKVLISATDMDSTPLKLVFFNNFETGTHGKDQLVWIAGRATSAAPFYFKQCGSYADGGLKANNPSMSGLTRIHEYYTESGWRDYKIGCVVSLGCGMFHKKLEPLDAKIREVIPDVVHLHDIPGHLRHLNVIKAVQTAKQGYRGLKQCASTARSFLFDVLIAEICESDEEPVRHTKAFCERDHTPFIRLSPQLDMPIELDENSDEKLVDMLITTKWYVQAQIDHFHRIKTLTEL